MKEKSFVSAVIYVHNAEIGIGEFLGNISAVLSDHFEHAEMICVNDHSEDESPAIIRNAAMSLPASLSLSVINMSYCHGRELSMSAGVDLAIGDFVFEFDQTTMDYHPSLIMDVYRHCLDGYDIVSASPDEKSRLSSRIFYWVYDRFSDVPGSMRTESFRILSRRAIHRIQSMNQTVPYRKAIYSQSGLRFDRLMYSVIKPQDPEGCEAGVRSGRQNKSDPFRFDLAVDTLLLFTRVGYDFSIFMTIFMMLLSVLMILYTIVIYATSQPVEGWTTTILFLSVAFFGLFGILTVVIKYLQLLIDLVFRKQHYSYESIDKLTQ